MADYRGLPGAFVFAFRRSDSYLLRAYAVTSAVVGVVLALFLLLALVSWLGSPGPFGQTAFLAVIGVVVFLGTFAPVLLVARRHRRSTSGRREDAILGLAGFGVLVSLFLALYVSAPDPGRPAGALEPAFAVLDALPRSYWPAPPLAALALLLLAVRFTRPDATDRPEGSGDGADSSDVPDASGTEAEPSRRDGAEP